MLIWIAQKKGFDALNATQKTSALCKVPFLKKSRKPGQNCLKWSKWAKITVFGRFFLFFSEMVLCRELRFFALHSVHQNPSFELSKSTIRQFFIFFTLRGDPFDLGGLKFYQHRK